MRLVSVRFVFQRFRIAVVGEVQTHSRRQVAFTAAVLPMADRAIVTSYLACPRRWDI
jgi:hypothetical protein